ncbi:MAG: Asp-tRNA(Asn)/Glu-tRNA(Gln) amidotransferase subunit GatC [Planctomycetota bacterium]
MANAPIDRVLLHQLCDLARLHVPQDKEAVVLDRLQRIVAAFSGLRDVALDQAVVDPNPGPELHGPCLRDDAPEPPLPRDEVLANAPKTAAGSFVVPRVVDS